MTTEAIESRFNKSVAIIIGIDHYDNGIPALKTAANDARRLATTLQDLHHFEVRLFLNQDASKQSISKLLNEQLPSELGADDRLIFYFAGHGVALDGDDGPNGYLLPQDARRGEEDSYLFMPFVHDALLKLPVRHALIIMDSCFSGAFRWAAARDLIALPSIVHEERYDRFVKDPAWQVITSTAHDQKAMDQLSSGSLGTRPSEQGHSPFALALFEALEGKADVVPSDGGDGLITATELYLYLESRLQPESIQEGLRQTPGLWPLSRHDKGEFVFATPGCKLDLPPAPPLNLDNNPYRGLESYGQQHADLFFGRNQVIDELENRIEIQALTVVLGASGTGKSSLVKAGLLPRLEQRDGLLVLPTVRPGANPLVSLSRALKTASSSDAIEAKIGEQCENNQSIVLLIDQFEELITMTGSVDEREATLKLISRLLQQHPKKLDIVLTLRTDFEPQFSRGVLRKFWKGARYIVPPMSQNDLRECIMKPAIARVMYFKPSGLVDELINEVVATPGALPLLSFALSEMYIHYLGRASDDRAIERIDYEAVGGVVGALRSRANAEFQALEGSEQRQMMRLIMLRMVADGKGIVARRRVLLSEFEFESAERNAMVKNLINRLVSARLVVTGNESFAEGDSAGEDYVEPAHDALVRAWGRLLKWVHEENEREPDDLRFQRKLTADASSWQQTKVKSEQKGLLWNDAARSASLKTLLEGDTSRLNRCELVFANKSILARRRIRQFWSVVMMIVVALAVVASWQANVATEQSKRAIARGVATEIRASLAEGNLYRALQLARRSAEVFKYSPETVEAMRAISTYNSALLASFRMPSDAQAIFASDDKTIIAYYRPDQRLDNYPFDVVGLNWSGSRNEITDGATSVVLSHTGAWLTTTGYNDYDSTADDSSTANLIEEQEKVLGCELRFTASVFDATQLGIKKEPHLLALPVNNYNYPIIGDQDSALLIACGSKVISVNIADISADFTWKSTSGFDTGSDVRNVFFNNSGQIFVVHKSSTSVYTRSGQLILQVNGEAQTVAANGRFVSVVESLSEPKSRVIVYNSKGQLIAEFSGRKPALSRGGRRLAFENLGESTGSSLVNLDSNEIIDQKHPLRNGHSASLRIFENRFSLAGRRPLFSPDGRLIMTLHGGRYGGGRYNQSAEKTEVTDAVTGRRLFEVAGEGVAFARKYPVLMTTSAANIKLWDMRRFPSKVPLNWDETWPSVDLDAFIALHSNGQHQCDEWADTCLSPDGKSKAVQTSIYSDDSPEEMYYEFEVIHDAANALPKPAYYAPELNENFICRWTKGIQFSRLEPWVLLACGNGIRLVHLNGEVLQSWRACSEGSNLPCTKIETALFSDDGRTVFSIREDRRVWVHTPGQPKSKSILLGPHESFISAVDRHVSGKIAIANGNGTIQVYDATGEPTYTMYIDVKTSPVKQLKFSENGQVLFARDHSDVIYRWSVSAKNELAMYQWIDDLSDQEWEQLTQ